jgi:hypothetical protein
MSQLLQQRNPVRIYAPETVFCAPEAHIHCRTWEEMRRIRNIETNLAVLERSPPHCPEAIKEMLAKPRGSAQTLFEQGMDIELVAAMLDDDLDLVSADSLLLYEDIHLLAENFLEITKAKKIGVRLERVDDDSCRLFHVDLVGFRLITTYFGKATEWLQNKDVSRSGLGQGSDQLVMREGAVVQNMQAGWVGIMKGEKSNNGQGLVHRSPAIARERSERLILRMDTLA